ncbi:MAG TPA: hypothetical protein VFV99_04745 [Kofleriaceae bacterium]|nr:hypothetical protein [Kofleriaceae bacterium]
MMDELLVTCPETGRREEIGCYVARDGELLVVLRCSRFEPPAAVTCATACAQCSTRSAAPVDPWRLPAD